MRAYKLTWGLVTVVLLAMPAAGQDSCRALNQTCGNQASRLCCNELQCAAENSLTAQKCTGCSNAICIGAGGLGICCATGFTCIPGFGCCPVDQTCETAGPDRQLTCCSLGTTCADPATSSDPEVCVNCPDARICEIQSASGALVKRCCPEGYTCDAATRSCKAACPPPLQPCNIPATDNCCPPGAPFCSYAWPPSSPLTEVCCSRLQLCPNPSVNKPFCCREKLACINGKCVDCPTGTQYCPSSGTCCRADGSEICTNSECCPKQRACGSGDTAICCPVGSNCINGACEAITPAPCPPGTYQCWVNSTTSVCCKDGTDCTPPPFGADPAKACCDPTNGCLDFPSMTRKVCCERPQQCLNMLWPSPGAVSADKTCCPQDNQCKWLDTSVFPPQIGKDTFCCATICTLSNPNNDASEKICCPKERYYELPSSTGVGLQRLCCRPGQVYQPPANGLPGGCVDVTPPCQPPTPQVCPLGTPPNGTVICCPEGTCLGGTIGCCKDMTQVCPVWPGWNPDDVKCCVAPEQCLNMLFPTSINIATVGATSLCCPANKICSWLSPNGPSKERYCCSTFCTTNYPFQGALVDICCPRNQVCGKDCCPPGMPCVDGRCCPEKHLCKDPITGEKICCREGRCTPDWLTGELVCCAKPLTSTTICLAPTFPFKRTCCPPGYVCMADGGCCPKAQYCYDPVSKKESCCKENQPCINGKCCDRTLNDVCRPWPSLQGQECCPKGNCLVAWNANPYPGIPTPPPVINTCCPPKQTCRRYLGGVGNICCMNECIPSVTPAGKLLCCPKSKTCVRTNSDGTVTKTCCRPKQTCKSGTCCNNVDICKPYNNPFGAKTICCRKPSACTPLAGLTGPDAVSVCCAPDKRCLGPNNQYICCRKNQSCQPVTGTNYNRCVP